MSDQEYEMIDAPSKVLDMRQAVFSRAPLSYRVGNSTLHLQTRFVMLVAAVGLIALLVLFLVMPASRYGSNMTSDLLGHGEDHSHSHHHPIHSGFITGSTYPLSTPVYSDRGYIKYRIAIVTDLDTDSKHPTEKNTWISYLKKGHLTVNVESQEVRVEWDKDTMTLSSSMAYGGRGMELSELVVFNGRLYAVDDRTGVIYEVDMQGGRAIPWVILTDGNGRERKGFKSEWATVKDETLIIGGLGKEWTTATGELVNHNPQWVKTVTTRGHVEHYDWTRNYEKLREAVGIYFPGYMIHEACVWAGDTFKRWVFLPRRSSTGRYNEIEDEHMGTNLMLLASEGFEEVKVRHIGERLPTHGFSTFKFIPGTKENLAVALKSEEVQGKASTYIMAFSMDGKVLMPETKVGDYKFEGIEFV
ncbi:Soluble calcium-activated nucleotidase 1 [Chionoecetes opilio]|uniref:Apyrase n=1 Tax=Chionoecetes opilio TaxID=41210 RepID=A0A8J4Y1C5_CHIOP|nr:Soluble calcium-activated nucleotidase 1 [Chionoecetes opilio]